MTVYFEITLILTIIYGVTLSYFFVGLLFHPAGRNKKRYPVSVIIAARNEQDNIEHILQDLTVQKYPKQLYEVLVADDNSTDQTTTIVKRFCKSNKNFKLVSIKDIPTGYSPKKYALECAVKKSRGEIILATDADCRVTPHWIPAMVSYFTPDVGFVAGFSQLGQKHASQNLLERLQAFDFLQLMSAMTATFNLGHPLAASGQNMGYRRTAFLQVGGYSKVAHRISGDDILMMQLVRKYTNKSLLFAAHPDAYATSKPHRTLKNLLNQRKRWASNGAYQVFCNIPFFIYLILVFLVNSILFFAALFTLFYGAGLQILGLCFLIKAGAEFAIAMRSTHYFNRIDLLRYFPLWFLVQMPYIVISGLFGTFGKFNWKDRNHSAEVREQHGNK